MSRNWVIISSLLTILAGNAYALQPVTTADPAAVKNELAYRVGTGRADDIKLLLTQGADPNGVNAQGLPLLLVAASRKDDEALGAVQALLEAGAKVNVKDKQGQTALYYASRAGKLNVVDYLLKNRIDYYSLDNNGDIARTIAFRAGHKDIVALMDNYVKGQTITVENTYKNAQNLQKDQQIRSVEQAKRNAQLAQQQAAKLRAQQEAERQRAMAQYKENLKKLDGKVYDISYNACAFQYWSFALSTNQTLEISDDEVQELLLNHRQQVQDASMDVMKMFYVGQAYVNKVIGPSKQAIYTQLQQMPSRTYRKEQGVGTLADVRKRCNPIAMNWEISMPGQGTPNVAAQQNNPPATAQQQDLQKRMAAQRAAAQAKKQPKVFPGRNMIQKTGAAAMQPNNR